MKKETKTFTLRLTDTEAEILNRLAFIYGVSKNNLLVYLLTQAYYRDYETPEKVPGLYFNHFDEITPAEEWAREYIKAYPGSCDNQEDITDIITMFKYGIEKAKTPEEKEKIKKEATTFSKKHPMK